MGESSSERRSSDASTSLTGHVSMPEDDDDGDEESDDESDEDGDEDNDDEEEEDSSSSSSSSPSERLSVWQDNIWGTKGKLWWGIDI